MLKLTAVDGSRSPSEIMTAARPDDLAVILPGKPRLWIERLLREGGRDQPWSAAP